MTNAAIIFSNSIQLMKEGVLEGTGEFLILKYDDGHTEEVEVPEPIHTYQAWKTLGYQVRKGEKAIAKFTIWKYTEKKAKEGSPEIAVKEGDTINSKMFMKMAAFFKMSQVEKIKACER